MKWTWLRFDSGRAVRRGHGALRPLRAPLQVDLVVSGHMHAYERTHPVGDNGAAVVLPARAAEGGADVYESPGLPVYVTQGNSGAAQGEQWERPAPAWSATRWANGKDSSPGQAAAGGGGGATGAGGMVGRPTYPYTYTDTFGFGLATFVNATAMLYKSVPITGSFTDKFWIVRPVPAVAAAP